MESGRIRNGARTVRERLPAPVKTAGNSSDVSDWMEHRCVIFFSFPLETLITRACRNPDYKRHVETRITKGMDSAQMQRKDLLPA